jgi:hypothetical protein
MVTKTSAYAQKQKRIRDYDKNPKYCVVCREKIDYERRHYETCGAYFCVQTRRNNLLTLLVQGRYEKYEANPRYCKKCGKKLTYVQAKSPNALYCSIRCGKLGINLKQEHKDAIRSTSKFSWRNQYSSVPVFLKIIMSFYKLMRAHIKTLMKRYGK